MGRRGSKYCEKCGCYLPEGETVCVSCGYDFITKILPTSKPSSELTVNDFDELLGTYSRYHTIEHKEEKYIPCENSSTALTYSKSTDWVYPTSMICDSKSYANNYCQSNISSEIYNRDSQAVAQCHTFLPTDYSQLVNVAPKIRQRTLDEVLDELEKESIYEQLARVMNQTSCSTVQASEAFTQLARDHRDAQKQVMLHEILWAKGGKDNPSIIRTPKAEKAFATSNGKTAEVKE